MMHKYIQGLSACRHGRSIEFTKIKRGRITDLQDVFQNNMYFRLTRDKDILNLTS